MAAQYRDATGAIPLGHWRTSGCPCACRGRWRGYGLISRELGRVTASGCDSGDHGAQGASINRHLHASYGTATTEISNPACRACVRCNDAYLCIFDVWNPASFAVSHRYQTWLYWHS